MFHCVIASEAKQSTVLNARCVGILCLSIAALAPLARNDTWNLVMLSEAKHLFAIAPDSKLPATARNVSIRAVGDYGDAALWNMGIVRAEHIQLKSVLGIGG